jgi:hypothetical protein
MISDTFRNFFEKFVEKDFSEKSKSILSNNEYPQTLMFNSNNPAYIKDRRKSMGGKNSPRKPEEFQTDNNNVHGGLNHLCSYNSFSSSAPLGKRKNKENYEELENDPFDNADGILSIDNSIPVRVIKGGRLQKKKPERMSYLDSEQVPDKQNRKTITVYKNLMNEELNSGNYTGLKHSKTLKNNEETSGLISSKDKNKEACIETLKETMKESTFDEGSTSTVKHHHDTSDLHLTQKNTKLLISTKFPSEEDDFKRMRRYSLIVSPDSEPLNQASTKRPKKHHKAHPSYHKLSNELEIPPINFANIDQPKLDLEEDNIISSYLPTQSKKPKRSYQKYLVEEEKEEGRNDSVEIEE